MRRFLVLAALAGIAWFVLKPSAVDRLSAPPAPGTGPAESGFVDVDASVLPVSPAYFSVPGRVTVVVFYDTTCPACIKLDRDMQDFMRARPDVAVRKVQVDLARLEVARRDYRWEIDATPCILIYDAKGRLVAADRKMGTEGEDLLYRWVNEEAGRAARPKA